MAKKKTKKTVEKENEQMADHIKNVSALVAKYGIENKLPMNHIIVIAGMTLVGALKSANEKITSATLLFDGLLDSYKKLKEK